MTAKRLLGLVALGAVLSLFSLLGMAREHQEVKALAAAEAWLALVDAGQYGASWDSAATGFRNAVKKGDWEYRLNASRKPLGGLQSRQVTSRQYRTTLPGAPDGEYVVVTFATTFAHKRAAIETLTCVLESHEGGNEDWTVAGYYIK